MSNRSLRPIAVLATIGALVLAPFGGSAQEQQVEERTLTLTIGEQTTISAEGVARYSEGVRNIVEVRLARSTPPSFVIAAQHEGQTSLVLFMEDGRQVRYRITVTAPGSGAPPPDEVRERENIRLDFYFVQLSESYRHDIGIGWPAIIGGADIATLDVRVDILGSAVTSATADIVRQPLPRLDLAQSAGWARLIRQAVLVTANGTQAKFTSGGEVNFQVTGTLNGSIQSIVFGSDIEVTPRYNSQNGRIDVILKASVSDLTEGGGTGLPGRTVTTLDTTVNLQLGEAIVIGGLTARSDRHQRAGLPGLSQIPILGVFFGTDTAANDEVENVLFIIPTVVEAVPRSRRDHIAEALRLYREFGGDLDDVQPIEPAPRGYR